MEIQSGTYLVLQGQRADGVWYDQRSSQWLTENIVQESYELAVARGEQARLVIRTITVTETETVVA